MAVGTAVPDNLSRGWQSLGYKGGSEPSVMNLSWLLQDQAGKWHVVTLLVGNAPEASLSFDAWIGDGLRLHSLGGNGGFLPDDFWDPSL